MNFSTEMVEALYSAPSVDVVRRLLDEYRLAAALIECAKMEELQ